MIFLILDNSLSVYDAVAGGGGGGGGGDGCGEDAVCVGAGGVTGPCASTSSTVIRPLGPVPATC